MKKSRAIVCSFAALSMVTVSACVTDPTTGQKKISNAAVGTGIGVVGGILLGGLIGGGTGRIIGAGIGGLAGGLIGSARDKQMRELREQTAGSQVDVSSSDGGQAILLNLPSSVTFDADSYNLKPDFRPTLDRIADNLRSNPNSLVDVYGYTDASESPVTAQRLSEDRARTVANYLATRGVSEARIRSQGFGGTLPVASNETPEGRALNRRVEIKIVPISQEQVEAARSGTI